MHTYSFRNAKGEILFIDTYQKICELINNKWGRYGKAGKFKGVTFHYRDVYYLGVFIGHIF